MIINMLAIVLGSQETGSPGICREQKPLSQALDELMVARATQNETLLFSAESEINKAFDIRIEPAFSGAHVVQIVCINPYAAQFNKETNEAFKIIQCARNILQTSEQKKQQWAELFCTDTLCLTKFLLSILCHYIKSGFPSSVGALLPYTYSQRRDKRVVFGDGVMSSLSQLQSHLGYLAKRPADEMTSASTPEQPDFLSLYRKAISPSGASHEMPAPSEEKDLISSLGGEDQLFKFLTDPKHAVFIPTEHHPALSAPPQAEKTTVFEALSNSFYQLLRASGKKYTKLSTPEGIISKKNQ